MKIGLLDFGDLANASHINDVVEGVVSYAQKAEKLGFERFWLSEHHPRSILWSNPMVMLSILFTQTRQINIGAGGILSAYHSPYFMYDCFKQLAVIFPGRVDLGFANGNPAINIQKLLLNKTIIDSVDMSEQFTSNVKIMVDLLENRLEDDYILPLNIVQPNRWVLTSSSQRLTLALDTGSNICFSTFHDKVDFGILKKAVGTFKKEFIKKHSRTPTIMLAFAGIIENFQQKAEKKYRDRFNKTYKDSSNIIVGTPDSLSEKFAYWSNEIGIDEFLFKDVETDLKVRKRNLKIISKLLKWQSK